MKLTILLTIFTGLFVLSCSNNSDIPSKTTSNGRSTVETRVTKLPPQRQPSTSSAAKSDEEFDIYFEQMITLNEEFVGVMQSLVDWQDSAYSEMQKMMSSTQVARSDFENWLLEQQAALEETYIGLRDIPGRWAAMNTPDYLADFHSLMLQVIRLKLEVVQKWQGGIVYILLDSNKSAKLIEEGDRLDDEADSLYFQAMSEGNRHGLPFSP